MADLLGALRRAIMPTESDLASRRWRRLNAEARKAGCPCGAPATQVRYSKVGGTVPRESWTCEAHVGVRGWTNSTPFWTRRPPCISHTEHCLALQRRGMAWPSWECPAGPMLPANLVDSLRDAFARVPSEPRGVAQLRCERSVVDFLFASVPPKSERPDFSSTLGSMLGIPIVVDPDLAPGAWYFVGSDGAILKSGTIAIDITGAAT